MKKSVKITLSVLVSLVLLTALLYIADGLGAPKKVNPVRKTADDVCELAVRGISMVTGNKKYDEYTAVTDIPKTEDGYVPQGYCFCEQLNSYVISYYHSENASILALKDAENDNNVKTLNLAESSGEDFKGHVGGVAADSNYLYLSDSKGIYRISLEAVSDAPDNGKIILTERMKTDVKCSFLNSDGEYLYAGEFYTFDGSAYSTDRSHHLMMSMNETSFARCNAYALKDIESSFYDSAEAPSPAMCFALPNRVQGFARLSDGSFALSTSYGRKNNSFLLMFSDVTKSEPTLYCDFDGESIPLYLLSKKDRIDKIKLPPMLEGIDTKDGRVTGIFESGAKKYSNAKFIENNICEF